jgi:hypothetical protein
MNWHTLVHGVSMSNDLNTTPLTVGRAPSPSSGSPLRIRTTDLPVDPMPTTSDESAPLTDSAGAVVGGDSIVP